MNRYGPVRESVYTYGESFLEGVNREDAFIITVRDSTHVHARASVGNAVTLLATAREPYDTFEGFNEAFFPSYERIGSNALAAFTNLVYNLNYQVTLNKPNGTDNTRIDTTFLVYPVVNGRIVTRADEDFTDERYNINLIDTQFHTFANKHGSGITLFKVNGLEIQFIKTGSRVRRGSSYMNISHIKTSCVNVKNTDDKCFMYAILSALHYKELPASANRTDPSSYNDYVSEYKWDGIEFPADYITAPKLFEALNPDAPFALHVWVRETSVRDGWKDPVSVYISKKLKTEQNHVDLLFANDEMTGNTHYVSIHNLPRMVEKVKTVRRKLTHLCRNCLCGFQSVDELGAHYKEGCYQNVFDPVIEMPRKGERVAFPPQSTRTPSTLFVTAHSSNILVNKTYRITSIGYTLQTHGAGLTGCILRCRHHKQCEENCVVVEFLDKMVELQSEHVLGLYDTDIHVVTSNALLMNQLLVGKVGYAISALNKVRFIDGNTFFKCELLDSMEQSVALYSNKWKAFREFCLEHYKLDPANYYSFPAFSWYAAVLCSGERADLITDEKMYCFFESAKRGGINIIPHRKEEANNPLVGEDTKQPTRYLANFDIRSSYGYSMKQPLPFSDFTWLSEADASSFGLEKIGALCDDGDTGYFFKVTLAVPYNIKWQNRFSDLPLAPNKKDVDGKRMLVCSYEQKEYYVLHYRLLKYYLKKGMYLVCVHAAVKFTQKPWLKKFADLQERLRESASDDIQSNTIKLMTNSVFGYSCMNSRKFTGDVTYNVNTQEGIEKFEQAGIRRGTQSVRQIAPYRIKTTHTKPYVKLYSPLYTGVTIMDLGKLWLYEWYYDKLMNKCDGLKLLYADTDSLICSMSNDPSKLIQENPQWFNSKMGSLKDESGGSAGVLFMGSKQKHYLYQTLDQKNVRIAGLPKHISSTLTSDVFIDSNENGVGGKALVQQTHKLQVKDVGTRYLQGTDVTRVYVDKYESYPYGHMLTMGDKQCDHSWKYCDKWCYRCGFTRDEPYKGDTLPIDYDDVVHFTSATL